MENRVETLRGNIDSLQQSFFRTKETALKRMKIDSYTLSRIDNCEKELKGIKESLDQIQTDPTIENSILKNFSKAIQDLQKKIEEI